MANIQQSNAEDVASGSTPEATGKSDWVPPQIVDLPSLTDLTLQTGIPGDCGIGGSGSTCF